MGVAALLAVSSPAQAQIGDRVALVIGNSAYPQAPLANPRNDAKAMATLLAQAGFIVDMRLDTTLAQLEEAQAHFGAAIKDPKVKFGLFYYAGHGLQQDWRNYLVPVTADIHSAEDIPKKTVDISELLNYMNQAKGRNFLVILDACRDDPFAGSFRPQAKGLSQFDAPVGSLLAYATAPGNVAMDGEGNNGLYTSNLLREFAVRGARIEDAFKRVRLNVRLASRGQQIPWESTSLEDDVYLFPTERKRLSESDQDQLLEKEIAAWMRIKSSTDAGALADFIREYPSGSASELAQARLNRILAAAAQQEAQRQAQAAATQAVAARDAQARLEAARREAEQAEAQRLAAQQAERARQEAAALTAARIEKERQDAAVAAAQRADAARQAEARQKEAQAQAARLEAERLAAARALQEAEQARVENQRLADARAEAARIALERERLQRQAQQQAEEAERARLLAQAAAEQAQRAEQQRQAQLQALAREAEKAREAMARLTTAKDEASARLNAQAVVVASAQGAAEMPPQVLAATPYSKGYQEFRRSYQTGDVYSFAVVDQFNKSVTPLKMEVTSVDTNADVVEYNRGEYQSDLMGNITKNLRGGLSTPRQFYPAELFVGKHWQTLFKQSRPNGVSYTFRYDLKVVGRETITVPAGTFDTFKIEARGYNLQLGARLERNIWVAPGVSADIAHEIVVRLRNGTYDQNDRQELVSLKLAKPQLASK